MKPTYFRSASAFRAWLVRHHATKQVLHVGYRKKASGKPSLTWPESVDEALCFGWIDGVRHSIDAESYQIRFTPRRPTSTWSAVNVARAKALIEAGRMQPAGRAAFAARSAKKSGLYSYEQRSADLPEPYAGLVRENASAWKFFERQTSSYRKRAMWWVVSAKKEETRLKRLGTLVARWARGRTGLERA